MAFTTTKLGVRATGNNLATFRVRGGAGRSPMARQLATYVTPTNGRAFRGNPTVVLPGRRFTFSKPNG